MSTAIELLGSSHHVVVQDFPDAAVPEALARAGLRVTVYASPDEADVVANTWVDGRLVSRPLGRRPDQADLIYVYRPLAELEAIVADARRMGVRAIWRQPAAEESQADAVAWRSGVEAAGLAYLDAPDIVATARTLIEGA